MRRKRYAPIGLLALGVAAAAARNAKSGGEAMQNRIFRSPVVVVAGFLLTMIALSSCCGLGMLSHGGHDHRSHEKTAAATTAQIGNEVTCPVDRMKLRVAEDTPWTEYRCRTYYFCSVADQQAFLKQPERYAAR